MEEIVMNRDFLKDFGLEQDQINKIMAEHGKSVQALKQEVEELKSDKVELNDRIEGLIALEEANKSLSDQLAESKQQTRDANTNLALQKAGVKEAYSTMVKRELDGVDDIESKLVELKEQMGDLFIQPAQKKDDSRGYKVVDTKLKEGQETKLSKEDIMAIKDTKERQRKIAENLNLFN